MRELDGAGTGLAAPAAGGLEDSLRAPPQRTGRLAVAVLVAVPLLAALVPTAAGRVPLNGDNPVQAFPLKVLAGHLIAGGHLPLWDPYVWSGTPLLAGFNAGALFPATALFSFLPAVWAWALTEALVYVTCDLGFYAFLRATGRSVGASFLGSLSFSFAGAMLFQVGHVDLVQGMALAPWILLALNRMAGRRGRGDWRWELLLAACFGLVILAGDPEALIDVGVLAGVYALALAWSGPGRPGVRFLLRAVAAAALGLALGAAQWVPGVAFVGHSQRASVSYAFFGSGSLPPALTVLFILPYLLGGYGPAGMPAYFGPYNLAEICGYVGVVPVIAAFALAGRRRRAGEHPLWVWYLVMAVGLVLALGSFTPLGHVLYHVPFYGNQRTQSRNLLDVDVALAVLLAVWVDRVRERRRGAPAGAGSGYTLAACLVPLAGMAAVGALLAADAPGLLEALGAPAAPSGLASSLAPYLAGAAVLAAVAAAVAGTAHLWPARWRVLGIGAVVAADVAAFGTGTYAFTTVAPPVLAAATPAARRLAAVTGPAGRFGIYGAAGHTAQLYELGGPDLNILGALGSVNGYGSAVDAGYAAATGVHAPGGLDPAALEGTAFDRLDMRALVAPEEAFARDAGGSAPTSASGAPAVRRVAPGARATWFLGAQEPVEGVEVAGVAGAPAALRIGVLGSSGGVTWAPPPAPGRTPGTLEAVFAQPVGAVGVVVADRGGSGEALAAPVVATAGGGRLVLDGPLAGAVQPPRWRWAGDVDGMGLFRNSRARGPYWLSAGGGSVRALGRGPGTATVLVTSPAPALLVRSVAYSPGWAAWRSSPGQAARRVGVRRVGPVQGVPVPAGTSTVTWRYRPTAVTAGWAASLAGAFGAVVMGADVLRRRRRRAAGTAGSSP